MIDSLLSEPRRQGTAAMRQHGRLMVGAAAALLIVGGAFVWRIAGGAAGDQGPTTSASAQAKNPVLNELVETTKALGSSQQQAIDQLQALQELVASQQAETKKSSDEVAALSEKLEALRQSFASIPAPSQAVADDPEPEKSRRGPRHSRTHHHASRTHAAAPNP